LNERLDGAPRPTTDETAFIASECHLMGFIDRLQKSIVHARTTAPILGWRWIFREKYLRRLGVDEVRFKADGLAHPVFCRVVSSDIYEYAHLLGRNRIPLKLPFSPKYIVDAGSNVGYSVLRFRSEFPDAKIVAVEPESRNVTQLRRNCSNYSNIFIEHAAVWSKTTKLSIKSPDAATNAFQVREAIDGDIQAISIDDIMTKHDLPRIDLLKIDIEGSEKEVFSDTRRSIWLDRVGMILVETHDRFEPGCADSVNSATKNDFHYKGEIGEYSFYVNRSASRAD
jgi:FkbM family methyltransferase